MQFKKLAIERRSPRTLASPGRLAWLAMKLCSSFAHRWLNLCEVGFEELLCAFRMRHLFAGVDLDFAAVPQPGSTLDSGHFLEDQDFYHSDPSPDIAGGQSHFEISWRTPWLYLAFLLLVWLLLF